MEADMNAVPVGWEIKVSDGPDEWGDPKGTPGRHRFLTTFRHTGDGPLLWKPVAFTGIESAKSTKRTGDGFDGMRAQNDPHFVSVVDPGSNPIEQELWAGPHRVQPPTSGADLTYPLGEVRSVRSAPAAVHLTFNWSNERIRFDHALSRALTLVAVQRYERIGFRGTRRDCPITLRQILIRVRKQQA